MKLNLGKRIVLFLHWLFSVVACAMVCVYCIKPDLMWNSFEMVYSRIGKRQTDIIGAACLAVYIILAIATVIIIVSNKEKREQRTFIIVDASETGRTRIAVSAVEQMIRQAVRGMDEIKAMKTSIKNMGDSIAIDADVTITDGAHIPSVTATIQRSVRSYIELNCGVTVKSICVNVRAVEQQGQKGKRFAKKTAENSFVQKTVVEPEIKEPEPVQSETVNEFSFEEKTPAADAETVAEETEPADGAEFKASYDDAEDNNDLK